MQKLNQLPSASLFMEQLEHSHAELGEVTCPLMENNSQHWLATGSLRGDLCRQTCCFSGLTKNRGLDTLLDNRLDSLGLTEPGWEHFHRHHSLFPLPGTSCRRLLNQGLGTPRFQRRDFLR
jgi:hypothetical protein